MARPREFDRNAALRSAMRIFWQKSYAATSTDDLVAAMGIGRQSLYNAFGDKRSLYLEAIALYMDDSGSAHLARLNGPRSPIEGIRNLLGGLIASDDNLRLLGCMGVDSIGEFGVTDSDLVSLRAKAALLLQRSIVSRVREGQAAGDIAPDLNPDETAGFVQVTMTGLQIAARGGASAEELQTIARFATDRLAADHNLCEA